jgi:FkbM family methyltransferase
MSSQLLKTFEWYKHTARTLGFRGLLAAIKCSITKTPVLCQKSHTEILYPFYLRIGTSDVPTYEQIFINRDYDFKVRHSPKIIIDAGANIGLAAIFFASKFPDAKIIAIEPENSNFDMLKLNTRFYDNIIPVQAALWNNNEDIELVDPGLGYWGFMTQDEDVNTPGLGQKRHRIKAVTVTELMKEQHIDFIDIFKIDIEGAEREVFQDSGQWLGKVDTIIAELHERMKPGCEQSFFTATKGIGQSWVHGENYFISKACLIKPDDLTPADANVQKL